MNILANNQTAGPLLSILIPTKNRPHTAIAAVMEAVKVGPTTEVEIVVQDCGDDDALEQMLLKHDLKDKIAYKRVGHPVSMTENWNIGLGLARGEYVVIIGDDDSVLPGIIDIARWAGKCGYAAVASKKSSFYGWPDFPANALAGKLFLKSFTGTYELRMADLSLRQYSGTGDEYRNLPSIYHGLVKRSVLERIRCNTGLYVDSLAPDMYSAYAIALNVDSFIMLDYPMTIVGASFLSNWGRNVRGAGHAHIAEFRNFQFTWAAPNSRHSWAVGTDCMARAFINCNRRDMLHFIDLGRVFGRTIVAEPRRVGEHVRKFVSATRSLGKNVPLAILKLGGNVVGKLALRAIEQLRGTRRISTDEIYSDVLSISQAVDIQQQSLIKNHVTAPTI